MGVGVGAGVNSPTEGLIGGGDGGGEGVGAAVNSPMEGAIGGGGEGVGAAVNSATDGFNGTGADVGAVVTSHVSQTLLVVLLCATYISICARTSNFDGIRLQTLSGSANFLNDETNPHVRLIRQCCKQKLRAHTAADLWLEHVLPHKLERTHIRKKETDKITLPRANSMVRRVFGRTGRMFAPRSKAM